MVVGAGTFEHWGLIIPRNLATLQSYYFELVFYLLAHHRHLFIHVDVSALNRSPHFCQAVLIQALVLFYNKLVVDVLSPWLVHRLELLTLTHKVIIDTYVIVLFNLCLVSPEIEGSPEASVHWRFVDDNCVFNIISAVWHDSNTRIMSSGQFIIIHQLNVRSLCHWLLRID